MIMRNEYLDDLKEMLRKEPESTYARGNTTRAAVLANEDIMEQLWTCYQKNVEDYDWHRDDRCACRHTAADWRSPSGDAAGSASGKTLQ